MEAILKNLTYGHYILTALKEEGELKTREKDYIAAGTVNWASEVSFDPPMLMVAVGRKSDLNETINYSGRFTLHILGETNKEMVADFASDSKISDGKINGYPFTKSEHAAILSDAAGYITCEVERELKVGDHHMYIGKVVNTHLKNPNVNLISTIDVPMEYSPDMAEI
jgi:flavin reductase (DIM6/NTAB) family NADH-FMN oxidoreductase RutF